MWPKRRMMHNTLERVETLPIREVTFRRKPDRSYEPAGLESDARVAFDDPAVVLFIEGRIGDLGIEDGVFLDSELAVNVRKVLAQLDVVRVVAAPCPVLVDFW